jgi:hypothetical protein
MIFLPLVAEDSPTSVTNCVHSRRLEIPNSTPEFQFNGLWVLIFDSRVPGIGANYSPSSSVTMIIPIRNIAITHLFLFLYLIESVPDTGGSSSVLRIPHFIHINTVSKESHGDVYA